MARWRVQDLLGVGGLDDEAALSRPNSATLCADIEHLGQHGWIPRPEVLTEEGEAILEGDEGGVLFAKFHPESPHRARCASQGLPPVALALHGDRDVVGVPHWREAFIHQRRIQVDQDKVRQKWRQRAALRQTPHHPATASW